jgi:hypothetical protein
MGRRGSNLALDPRETRPYVYVFLFSLYMFLLLTNDLPDEWPEQGLTGFRDPFVIKSPVLTKLLGKSSGAMGDNFLAISGRIHQGSESSEPGGHLFLYRQTSKNDVRGWTYIAPDQI